MDDDLNAISKKIENVGDKIYPVVVAVFVLLAVLVVLYMVFGSCIWNKFNESKRGSKHEVTLQE